MKATSLILALTATFGLSTLARAEAPDPATLKGMYDSGRNMSGLIKHCVDKGYLKADSTENANKMVAFVANMPGAFDKADGDKNESFGRKGEVLTDGQYKSLQGNLPPDLSLKQWCVQADQGMRKGLKQIGL
ncbi:hypothetical protein NJC08_05640 [Pseudomonas fluorescens]|jgi:hypothetical protein|uniref:hypothetical protein n=1 Tax=Pseudomonas fluorescens group TaxID=136843 RepID=UPI001413115D|nr:MULTISPECIES: hypothetical protein [Pseudomonas fluorescens group]MCO7625885.1 hypothetical protein [Pseudomonas fluorescens]NHX01484.1 hypothetical protein [Pseudomonas koreensis]